MQIHHKNEIKSDNNPDNLQALSRAEHCKVHIKKRGQSDKFKEQARVANIRRQYNPEAREANLNHLTAMQEKARLWHQSEEGRAWHSEHGKKTAEKVFNKSTMVKENCRVCGKEFMAYKAIANRSLYCHPNCKATALRRRRKQFFNHKIAKIEFYGYEDVYNLYVDNTNCFACEGVIVHNCDSLRYFIMTREKASLIPEVKPHYEPRKNKTLYEADPMLREVFEEV
jgi:hypothetical protein